MKNLISRKLLLIAMLIACRAGFAQNGASDTLKFNKYREFPDYVTQVFKKNHPELTFLKYRVFTPTTNIFDWYKGYSSPAYTNNEGGYTVPAHTDSICNAIKYLGMVNSLEISNYDTVGNINLQYTFNNLINYMSKGYNPISLSFIEYSEIKDTAIYLNCIGFNNSTSQFTENAPNGFNPFQKDRLFAASSLNQVVYTSQVNFLINDSLILSNIPSAIDSIYIDFADGNGLVPVTKGNVYSINYATEGIKNLQLKIKADTAYYSSFFTMYDSASVGNAQNRTSGGNSINAGCDDGVDLPDRISYISATAPKPWLQSPGVVTGRYGVWYATCTNNAIVSGSQVLNPLDPYGSFLPTVFSSPRKIRKPFIISTGFNPGNGKQILENGLDAFGNLGTFLNFILDLTTVGQLDGEWRGTMYETYNGAIIAAFDPGTGCPDNTNNGDNMLDRLRDEGYDVIILQYDDGEDFIENNAALIKQLITDINTEKMSSPNPSFFENIVGGPSAGAVSTRLALAQMEQDFIHSGGPHPHTKEWISIEGEHAGSGIPLGFSYLIDYQSNATHLIGDIGFIVDPLLAAADLVNTLVAGIASGFNHSPCATELTTFNSADPIGTVDPLRQALLHTFATTNGSNGYPEFVRRVGVSMGSGTGVPLTHSSNSIFDVQLGWGGYYSHLPCIPFACEGYNWNWPGYSKNMTANYWDNSNNLPLFTAGLNLSSFTILPETCVQWWLLDPFCCCDHSQSCGTCIATFGPFNVPAITFGNVTVLKPSTSIGQNIDEAPSSTQTTQLSLYNQSAYPLFNDAGVGSSYCNVDADMHTFVPTVSAFDIQPAFLNSSNPLFTSPVTDLNLMFNKVVVGTPVANPFNTFGFPFITHPTNPRAVTPFDAVFACGNLDPSGNGVGFRADGVTLRPNNQYHVEDPLKPYTDFLVRVEVAPLDLYLSNRQVGSTLLGTCGTPGCYTAEFEARNSITVGNGIYAINPGTDPNWQQNNLTPDGDFGVMNGAKVILHSGGMPTGTSGGIALMPGVNFLPGGEADVFIDNFPCPLETDHRQSSNTVPRGGIHGGNSITASTNTLPLAQNAVSAQKTSTIKVYPNPSNGMISIDRQTEEPADIIISDLNGKIVYTSSITGSGVSNIDISTVQNGAYLLQVGSNKFKVMVVK
jgi:hypothetical protein